MSALIINSLEYDTKDISQNIIELIRFSRKVKIPIFWLNNSKTITEFEKIYKQTKDFTFDQNNILYYLKKHKITKIYLTNFTTNDVTKDFLSKIKESGISYYTISDCILYSQETENTINFEKFKENNTSFGSKSFLILDALNLDINIETFIIQLAIVFYIVKKRKILLILKNSKKIIHLLVQSLYLYLMH